MQQAVRVEGARGHRLVGRRRATGAVLAGAALVAVLAVAGCAKTDAEARRHTKVQTLVAARLIPIGKAAVTAKDDGSMATEEVPGDLVPEDAITSIDDIKCLVALQGLPRGTVLRRSMFVDPARLGLSVGLTGGTDRPAGC